MREAYVVMITLSARAANQIRTMQKDNGAEEKFLRLLVEEGGCSGRQYGMSFDEAKADDVRCESEGVAMVLDEKSAAFLKGTVIDFDDGLQGRGFEIKNPNAQSTCGCGKSFA
jgi:iron-sulfur cluster assembly accessory protein